MDTSWLPRSVGQTGAPRIATAIGNLSFRATGISTYSKNGGSLETAVTKANHYSARTTRPNDRPPL
jgi:hypothetical protein